MIVFLYWMQNYLLVKNKIKTFFTEGTFGVWGSAFIIFILSFFFFLSLHCFSTPVELLERAHLARVIFHTTDTQWIDYEDALFGIPFK
jgi:hypothetical protein